MEARHVQAQSQLQQSAQHVRGAILNAAGALAIVGLLVVPLTLAATTATNSCQLKSPKGAIQHVIYVQFDNTHFRRDNPDVPSDLEQMPHLLNFIQDNGVLMSNDHTVLISHTATGILTSLTGVYPDRMGQPVSNSFRYFNSTDGTTRTGVSFAYWTSPLFDPSGSTTDTTPEMINENGKIAPAPWVPFTRAGCDFGAVATANTILENTAIDIPTVFGAGSPEAMEVASNPGQAFADFVGIGVHCAQDSGICAQSTHARPDLLPDEPGDYSDFNGLFGAKYVNPVIKPSGPMTDLDGTVIQDATGHIGFPGFDGMEATVSLAWVAQMQEAGIPVTYAYISDAHDGHGATQAACAFIPARTNQSFAWNHGDIQDEIASTWVGYVGQGVDPAGVDSTTWSDHTDVRPTILELVGLNDDYVHDGRVISEILQGYARPLALKKSTSFVALAQMYKQLNAPFGAFAMTTLRASTKALASNDADDATYNSIEGQIQALTTQRNTLAAQMISLLDGAEFKGKSFGDAQAQSLIGQGQALLNQANALPH